MREVRSAPGWIFSRTEDVALFGGTAFLSLTLALVGLPLGLWDRPFPMWAWAATVLLVDVAHVWSTIFRVYLDGEEVRRRPWLYCGAPLAAYALGVLAYARLGHLGFWRTLAYVAVWHFVRQQVGWVAVYHRLRSEARSWDARLDKLAVYACTLGPVLWWHAHLPRAFDWFVAGDFAEGIVSVAVGRLALGAMWLVLALWVVRQATRARPASSRRPNPGVALVIVSTFACWFGGIVLTNNDWCFTFTNVLIHGVPYLALLWRYARNRFGADVASEAGAPPVEEGLARRVVSWGVIPFIALLVALALVEEALWDQLAWHERTALFGDLGLRLDPSFLQWIVPLLALPQATHYVLDGFVWKGGASNPALTRTLGWQPIAHSDPSH
jgi:hypothetical protein